VTHAAECRVAHAILFTELLAWLQTDYPKGIDTFVSLHYYLQCSPTIISYGILRLALLCSLVNLLKIHFRSDADFHTHFISYNLYSTVEWTCVNWGNIWNCTTQVKSTWQNLQCIARNDELPGCNLNELTDPAQFSNCRITSNIIELMLWRDNIPSDTYVFQSTGGRTCSRVWFYKPMPDGQKRTRKWLAYCKSRDAQFCVDCMLLSGPETISDKWIRQAYSDWGHATKDIGLHESSPEHHCCEVGRFTYINESRVDDRLLQISHKSATRNRRVVYVSIKCLKYLCSEMTAVRGHASHDGKFRHLFRKFAKFYATSAAYIEMLSNSRDHEYIRKPEINIRSPLNIRRLLIQNERYGCW